MIRCFRCAALNEDTAKFCGICGYSLQNNNDIPTDETLRALANELNAKAVTPGAKPADLKRWKFSEKAFAEGVKKHFLVILVAIFSLVLVFGLWESKYLAFLFTYKTGNYSAAVEVKEHWPISYQMVDGQVEAFINGEVEKCYNDYLKERVSYVEVVKRMNTIKQFAHTSVWGELNRLRTSRLAFQKAEKYEKEAKPLEAVVEYLKVIEEDTSYYAEAKERMDSLKEKAKKELFDKMEECLADNDFFVGLKYVQQGETFLKGNQKLRSYRVKFEKCQKDYYMQELKESQKVEATNAGYNAYYHMLTANIENHSDKTVKTYDVVFLAYDPEGKPIKLAWEGSDKETYSPIGYDNSLLAPGAVANSGGWTIEKNESTIATVLACIAYVEFTDGTTWDNPYYYYWYDEYEERRLEQ